MRTTLLLIAYFLVFLSGCSSHAPHPSATRPGLSPRDWKPGNLPDDEVNLLLFGDWGSNSSSQYAVAEAMADYVDQQPQPFNAAVTVGDNFYPRSITSPEHPYFQTLFEDMYDPARLNMPFYLSLGNHDYDPPRKMEAELEYARRNPWSRWKLPAQWYRLDFPQDAERPILRVLVLDSNKSKLTAAQWEQQKSWLESELNGNRNAPWTLVVAHHPLFSNGLHGDNGTLQREWGPILKRHQVDFYVCGHDHDLQHLQLKDWYTQFLLVGGGGAGRRLMRTDGRGPFSRSIHGFAHLRVRDDKLSVKFIAADGSVVHQFERTPSGKVDVLRTTGTEKPTTNPTVMPSTVPTTTPIIPPPAPVR